MEQCECETAPGAKHLGESNPFMRQPSGLSSRPSLVALVQGDEYVQQTLAIAPEVNNSQATDGKQHSQTPIHKPYGIGDLEY